MTAFFVYVTNFANSSWLLYEANKPEVTADDAQ